MGLSDAEWQALWLSAQVGCLATLLVLVPGIGLGWLLARKSFRGRLLLDVLVHLPLVVTPIVVGYGLLVLFGRRGVIGRALESIGIEIAFTTTGAVLAAAVIALPLVVRSVRTAIELVDPRLEEAAAVLGASPCRRFFTVTLPLAFPGVLAGLLLGFARSLGEFGATITLAGNIAGETQTLPLALFNATQLPGGEARAARLMLLSIGLSVLAVGTSEWFARRARQRAEGGR